MVCMYCRGETRVTNSRLQKRFNHVWRRRKCQQCTAVLTTIEHFALDKAIGVTLRDGSYEPFNRLKLVVSIYESLRHRKDALEAAEHLSDTIIGNLQKHIQAAQITRQEIITETLVVLGRFDAVGATYYGAYHTA